jgi:O-antigen/teichoic acid export membrane protein
LKSWVNIFFLATAQAFNAITPILVFPNLLLTLGSEKYAEFVFAESLSFIVLTAVLFGFEISGVKLIAQASHAGENLRVRQIFSDILYLRLLILGACISFVIAVLVYTGLSSILALLCWCLVPLGYILQSTYFFIGREQNMPVAIFTAIGRIFLLFAVFIYIKPESPSYLPALLIGISYALTGACCLTAACISVGRLTLPSARRMKALVSDGWNIFVGNIFVMLLKDTPVIYLRALGFSSETISVYSIADKGLKALQASMRPLNQHFFSLAVKKLRGDDIPNRKTLAVLLKGTWPQAIAVSAAILTLSFVWIGWGDQIIRYFSLAVEIDSALGLLFGMLPAVLIGVFNFMLGAAGLSSLNASREMALVIGIAALLSGVSFFLLSTRFGLPGAALNVVLGELIMFALVLRQYLAKTQLVSA